MVELQRRQSIQNGTDRASISQAINDFEEELINVRHNDIINDQLQVQRESSMTISRMKIQSG